MAAGDDIYLEELNPYAEAYNAADFDGGVPLSLQSTMQAAKSSQGCICWRAWGESKLPSDFSEQLEKENMETGTLFLLTANMDCMVIYSSSNDIFLEKRDMLADFGVKAFEGMAVEGDWEHHAFQILYVLLPDMNSHEITDSLIEESHYPKE